MQVEGRARAIRREQSNLAWLAWHIAALERTKKMPPLHKLMPKQSKKRRPAQSWEEQLRLVQLMHVWFGGDVKELPCNR